LALSIWKTTLTWTTLKVTRKLIGTWYPIKKRIRR
jgi:hypothetical protein